MRLELRSETEAEILLWVSFSGADEARAMAIRVLIYVAMATIVVLSTGKKLERKETPPMQADKENVVAPVQI